MGTESRQDFIPSIVVGLSPVRLRSDIRAHNRTNVVIHVRYLPPPVLDVLNNKRMEAAKRAAIITTALQWLLNRVPLRVVPPQFRFGFMVAQRLVPYLGYVGGFVAWSWGAMKSFDKGARDDDSTRVLEIDSDAV